MVCVRMRLCQREVSECESHLIAESLLDCFEERVGAAAMRTLEVTVFEKSDGCVIGT